MVEQIMNIWLYSVSQKQEHYSEPITINKFSKTYFDGIRTQSNFAILITLFLTQVRIFI